MNFTDTFETPITIPFEGHSYLLEKLKTSDLAPWCAELEQACKDRNLPILESTLTGAELAQAKMNLAAREFTPDDCIGPAATLLGSQRVIRKAFSNHLKEQSDVLADRFMDSLPWRDRKALSVRLCALISKQEFDDWFNPKPFSAKQEETRPNADAASAANPEK